MQVPRQVYCLKLKVSHLWGVDSESIVTLGYRHVNYIKLTWGDVTNNPIQTFRPFTHVTVTSVSHLVGVVSESIV